MSSLGIFRCTVTLPRRSDTVLLGRKTEKIGVGLFNGPGGNINSGEGTAEATVRELFEETGLVAEPWAPVPLAIVDCYNKKEDGTPSLTKLFVSEVFAFKGEPRDGRELIEQQWFPIRKLPFSEMLPGDASWMGRALMGERFIACVYYQPGMRGLERETAISPVPQQLLNRLWELQ